MATNYDEIAEQYGRSKQSHGVITSSCIVCLNCLARSRGAAVLDLACGEGHYTRILKRLGAAQVVGVDLSSRMIELARAAERDEPLGVEYFAGDAREHPFQACLDVVVAAYLLNYARSSDELFGMALAIHRGLKPGDRLVAVNNNSMQQACSFGSTPEIRLYQKRGWRTQKRLGYPLYVQRGWRRIRNRELSFGFLF